MSGPAFLVSVAHLPPIHGPQWPGSQPRLLAIACERHG
jgi:hypothetical protein